MPDDADAALAALQLRQQCTGLKSRTRSIYHSCSTAIRGHAFCSFLSPVLQKELADRFRAIGTAVGWDDSIRDLDRSQRATV